MVHEFDLCVIGAGSGGVRAARLAGAMGLKVVIVEEYRFGGTCVIRGCVPKKLMVYASEFSDIFKDSREFGWLFDVKGFDWNKFMAAKDAEIDRLENLYQNILTNNNVTYFRARAAFKDAHHVVLSTGETIKAKTILIATGARPFIPNIEGHNYVLTSNDIFALKNQPDRVLIVGGGYIACEFASIFNGLGTQTIQLYRGEQILRGFDQELREFVAKEMRAKGINLYVGRDVKRIEKHKNSFRVYSSQGDYYDVDQVIYATGRVPYTNDLGLELAGVTTGARGEVLVDRYSKTSVDHIYAVGDVTNRVSLTPVAIVEAACFIETRYNNNPIAPDYELIPTAVFTQPEIGTIGDSEETAMAKGAIDVYIAKFKPMKFTLANRNEQIFMKLIVSKSDNKVLGCHIAGHNAGEMIQLASVAIKMGATKADFDRTMAVHPTVAEELVTMSSITR